MKPISSFSTFYLVPFFFYSAASSPENAAPFIVPNPSYRLGLTMRVDDSSVGPMKVFVVVDREHGRDGSRSMPPFGLTRGGGDWQWKVQARRRAFAGSRLR